MHFHFVDDPPVPRPVHVQVAKLRAELTDLGHEATEGGAGAAPPEAIPVTLGPLPPEAGVWLRWDHAALLAGEPPPEAPDGVVTVGLGPWLGAWLGSAHGATTAIPVAPADDVGRTRPADPVHVAFAAPGDAAVGRACELARDAGLTFEAIDARATPPSEWDALVCDPEAFAQGGFLLALEAMARGVPCILPDRAALRREAESAALFCDFGTDAEIAEALVLVARHPEVRAALANNSRFWARPRCNDQGARALVTAARPLCRDAQPAATGGGGVDRHALTGQIAGSLRQLAELYRQADEWSEARTHLEAAHLLTGSDDPDQLDRLAYARYLAGDDAGALSIYDRLLAERGHAVQETRGMILLGMGQHRAAVEALRDALRAGPATATLHNSLGYALFRDGDRASAAAQFREALRLDPGCEDARANLAELG